jgi:hypothetical protein
VGRGKEGVWWVEGAVGNEARGGG